MNRIALVIVCLNLVFFSCEKATIVSPAQYACTGELADHPKAAEFQALLDNYATRLPGVQVALRTPDGQAWTGAAGMADIPNEVSLDACHKMMIGSISKVFTATLIFQLQDEGVLSIDDRLDQWLGDEVIGDLANGKEVSLRQMLNHTSGLYDYLDNNNLLFDALNRPFYQLTAAEKLEYAQGKPANNAPGAAYYYSNTNFVLLGLVVEAASGLTLPEALQSKLFGPLGLSSAVMGTPERPIPAGTARPYLELNGERFIDFMHVEVSDAATGDGGIAINALDLIHFIEPLLAGDILSTASLEEMTESLLVKPTDQADFDWDGESTGLGIDLFQTPYGAAYGHTGAIFAFNAFLFHYPTEGASLAISYNATSLTIDGPKEDLRKALMAAIFE